MSYKDKSPEEIAIIHSLKDSKFRDFCLLNLIENLSSEKHSNLHRNIDERAKESLLALFKSIGQEDILKDKTIRTLSLYRLRSIVEEIDPAITDLHENTLDSVIFLCMKITLFPLFDAGYFTFILRGYHQFILIYPYEFNSKLSNQLKQMQEIVSRPIDEYSLIQKLIEQEKQSRKVNSFRLHHWWDHDSRTLLTILKSRNKIE